MEKSGRSFILGERLGEHPKRKVHLAGSTPKKGDEFIPQSLSLIKFPSFYPHITLTHKR